MLKKISAKQLQVGMYVHSLHCSWLRHPFTASRFRIKNKHMIAKIHGARITVVTIDTEKGCDIAPRVTAPEAPAPNPTTAEKNRAPQALNEELHKAIEVREEANKVAAKMMNDVRLGKQIEIEQVTKQVQSLSDSVFRNQNALATINRLKTVDEYTFQHSVSVCVLLVSFAKYRGLGDDIIKSIGIGGFLHDIGKMKVPLNILNKKGRFTDDEFTIMKRHVPFGEEIIEPLPGVPDIASHIVAEHHERFQGGGYPRNLTQKQLSLYGQMATIVDVYDALTSNRCYHKGKEPGEALKIMYDMRNSHFNPDLMEEFIQSVGIYPVGSLVRLSNGFLGFVTEQNERDLLRPKLMLVRRTAHPEASIKSHIDLTAEHNVSIDGTEECSQWGLDLKRDFVQEMAAVNAG